MQKVDMTATQFRDLRSLSPPGGVRDRFNDHQANAATCTVMIVDDEPINIKVVQKYLQSAGYEDCISTSDSRETLEMIRHLKPDVLLLDIMMPHLSGFDILEEIRADHHLDHLPVLFLTASTDERMKTHALELGVTDFLTKPVKPTELIPRIRNTLVLKAHHDQMEAYSKRLEQDVRQRTAELIRSREELLHVLACAAEYRDTDTGNHVLRVGRFAGILARQLGLGEERSELIEQAAILHDVGKIGIPDAILLKPGKLSEDEMARMRKHCEFGRNILRAEPTQSSVRLPRPRFHDMTFRSPILATASIIAMSHHEKWDGTGYPLGLSGDAIPLEGRITAVADVFDALSTRRPYKEAMPLDRCCDILEEGRGIHFDPAVLDAFFISLEEILHVALEMAD